MSDTVSPLHMTEARLEGLKSFSVAARIPYTNPEVLKPHQPEAGTPHPLEEAKPVAIPRPQIVGRTITGREWIVMQLPSGGVRGSYQTEDEARFTARDLAAKESGEFGVFQPRGISRPQTTVTEELL